MTHRPRGGRSGSTWSTVAVDHVVVGTPDLHRTLARLAGVGLQPRWTAEGLQGGDRAHAFFVRGPGVLELIGPATHDPDRTPAPAAFVGLAFTVTDLDAVAALDGVAGSAGGAVDSAPPG